MSIRTDSHIGGSTENTNVPKEAMRGKLRRTNEVRGGGAASGFRETLHV
jgi:hypothetical protein